MWDIIIMDAFVDFRGHLAVAFEILSVGGGGGITK